MISDGECQEGTTWESMLIASKHRLNNLVLIIDYNKIQALSKLKDALPLHNLSKKIKSFNCNNKQKQNKKIIKKFKTPLKKKRRKDKYHKYPYIYLSIFFTYMKKRSKHHPAIYRTTTYTHIFISKSIN